MEGNINVNGVEYAPIPKHEGNLKIAILQRGWVMVGQFERDGNDCTLHNASVVRIWGTTKGLGEIALGGPTSKTKLDPCGTVRFDIGTSVALIDCNESAWPKSGG